MEIAAIFSSVKDIALAIAAVVTATVAVIGLKSWRRELEGKKEFESALAFVKATYKLRDRLHICRSPLVRMYEFPEGYSRSHKDNTPDENANAWAFVYRVRWEPVWESVQDFDARTLEAEAFWGQEIKKRAEKFKDCVRELNSSIDSFLNNELSSGEDFRCDPDFGREIRANLSATRKEENPLTQRIEEAVSQIETFVRPHLKDSKARRASIEVSDTESSTKTGFFNLNDLKFSGVGLALFFAFLLAAWLFEKNSFMSFVMDDLVWLALWSVLFSILIGVYLFKTHASSRLGRALLGVGLIVNGLLVNISVGPSITRLGEITGNMDQSSDWYVSLLLAIEALEALKGVGAIGVAAVGAGVVAGCLLPSIARHQPTNQ